MIVVDTSVWVDFFRDADTPQVQLLVRLIDEDEGVALTDIVLTEILQGLGSEDEVARVDEHLSALEVLRLEDLDDFRRAASLYRQARRQGVTIRRTLDCLIASVCVREGVPILHADTDFDRLASCTELETLP